MLLNDGHGGYRMEPRVSSSSQAVLCTEALFLLLAWMGLRLRGSSLGDGDAGQLFGGCGAVARDVFLYVHVHMYEVLTFHTILCAPYSIRCTTINYGVAA